MVNRKHNLHQQWNILHGPTLSDKLYHSEYTCISMKINYTCLKLLIEIGIVTCVLLQFMFWIVLEQMTLNLGKIDKMLQQTINKCLLQPSVSQHSTKELNS